MQIKLHIKDGKVKMVGKGSDAIQAAAFTEKLAKDLGEIEERHKGHNYEQSNTQNTIKQQNS